MKFYHGTSEKNWKLIQEEGVLWGIGRSYRYTYLTPEIGIAKGYGDVILEVDYIPVGIDGNAIDNYCFEHEIPKEEREKGAICWQFSVFIPIDIKKVKRII